MNRILTMNGRRRTADGRRAFTLIEMMAALVLAVILLYMVFQIFTTSGRAITKANAHIEISANARAILRIIHQEVSGAFLDASQDADGDDDADYFIIKDNTWSSPANYPDDSLQFLTNSAVGTSSGLNEVGYWLDTRDALYPILRRRLESADFDASDIVSLTDPTTPDEKLDTILGENVLAFNVEYYDPATDTFTDGNYTAKEKTASAALPFPGLTTALRVTIIVKDKRGRFPEGEEFREIITIKGRE